MGLASKEDNEKTETPKMRGFGWGNLVGSTVAVAIAVGINLYTNGQMKQQLGDTQDSVQAVRAYADTIRDGTNKVDSAFNAYVQNQENDSTTDFAKVEVVDSLEGKVNIVDSGLASLILRFENDSTGFATFKKAQAALDTAQGKRISVNTVAIGNLITLGQLDSLRMYVNQVTGKMDSVKTEFYNALLTQANDWVDRYNSQEVPNRGIFGRSGKVLNEINLDSLMSYAQATPGVVERADRLVYSIVQEDGCVSDYEELIKDLAKPLVVGHMKTSRRYGVRPKIRTHWEELNDTTIIDSLFQ